MTCIFCDLITPEQILLESDQFKLVFDIDPIQTGHLLLISKRHVLSMADLSLSERHELVDLEARLISLLEAHLSIDGVTLASNDKGLMDEGTHFHVHLIPRRTGDGFWDKIDLETCQWELETFLKAL
ncbi:HIT family protein [Streptococcus entericus]|uniref:HIT family protein n=1 Tax=Streptococcus entericus TaxID=155680 RepID=UPI0003619A9D|nr:HIT family protein [Streptococcus entericus]